MAGGFPGSPCYHIEIVTHAPLICVGRHAYTHLRIHENKMCIGSGILVSGEHTDIFIIKVLEHFILIQSFAF